MISPSMKKVVYMCTHKGVEGETIYVHFQEFMKIVSCML